MAQSPIRGLKGLRGSRKSVLAAGVSMEGFGHSAACVGDRISVNTGRGKVGAGTVEAQASAITADKKLNAEIVADDKSVSMEGKGTAVKSVEVLAFVSIMLSGAAAGSVKELPFASMA
mmetsp:Transcript_18992/g.29665  ORF Transcript_18992/g.29665 Transcript_18992/m.29665 type:complete len:118 (+) Transcript_18992:676-1029(+)